MSMKTLIAIQEFRGVDYAPPGKPIETTPTTLPYYGIGWEKVADDGTMIRCAAQIPESPSPQDVFEALNHLMECLANPTPETCAYGDEVLVNNPKVYRVKSLQ